MSKRALASRFRPVFLRQIKREITLDTMSRDFAPVTLVAAAPYVLVVPPSLPARTVKDLLGLAKARPGELTYASLGSGSTNHLSGELFAYMAGVKLVHVPYKNNGQALADLIAGHVQMLFLGIVSAQPHVKGGRLRALATSGLKRSPLVCNAATQKACRRAIIR
jgi:tripartite-type tricarboxylate transporter receptor subunit TctC